MRMKIPFASALLVVTMAACAQAPPPAAPDTRASDAQAIRNLIASSSTTSPKNDPDKFFAFYDPDASLLMPDAPILTGLPAIREALDAAFADPNLSIVVRTTKVEVSKAGDYGYAQGTVVQRATNPKTRKIETREGKWVTVFRKDANGSWKAVADTFNFNGPAVTAKK